TFTWCGGGTTPAAISPSRVVAYFSSTAAGAGRGAGAGRPRGVSWFIDTPASKLLYAKSKNPSASCRPHDRTVDRSANPLAARLASRPAQFTTCGSTATTRPVGPTTRAARTV